MCDKSKKAGLQFSVNGTIDYINKFITPSYLEYKISVEVAVIITSTLEYLSAEILELSGNNVSSSKVIHDNHIEKGICSDEELNGVFGYYFVKKKNETFLQNEITKIGRHLDLTDGIKKVLKQVHPNLDISDESCSSVCFLLSVMRKNLIEKSINLCKFIKKDIVENEDILIIIRMIISNELGKHALLEASKAVYKFTKD